MQPLMNLKLRLGHHGCDGGNALSGKLPNPQVLRALCSPPQSPCPHPYPRAAAERESLSSDLWNTCKTTQGCYGTRNPSILKVRREIGTRENPEALEPPSLSHTAVEGEE